MAARVEKPPQWFPLTPSSSRQQEVEQLAAGPPLQLLASIPRRDIHSVELLRIVRCVWDRREHLAGRCPLPKENIYPGGNPNQKGAIIYITNGKGSATLPEVDEYEIEDFEWSSETLQYYSKYKDRQISDWQGKWPKISDFANNTWDMLLRDEAEFQSCGGNTLLPRTPTTLEDQRYSIPSTPPMNPTIRQAP